MKLFILTFAFLISFQPVFAERPLRFALVPKEATSNFFKASQKGCEQAAKSLGNVVCLYQGSEKTDVRIQNEIILKLIDDGIDGLAVSVTQSEFLAKNSIRKANEVGIPVITYDSDFTQETLSKYPNLRLAYVGTNNIELGKTLGKQLMVLRPQGGKLVIQTGRPDSPNLSLRVMGLRSVLADKEYKQPPGERLMGENGWQELSEPLTNYGLFDKALRDLNAILRHHKKNKLNAFVAVGGWPQFMPEYRETLKKYQTALIDKDIVLVIGDTTDEQLAYLKESLSHVNVGQNSFEMGKQAIMTLYKIKHKQPYKTVSYTPITVCYPYNVDQCTNY